MASASGTTGSSNSTGDARPDQQNEQQARAEPYHEGSTEGSDGDAPAQITVFEGDITGCRVDAVVTAANNALAGGGGVDGAIHAAAGPRLLQASRAIGHCPTGGAVVTPGFDLPARWVIHAVGPIWRGGDLGEPELLASAYRSVLARAEEVGAASIAIPAISTGVYGFPSELAATVAVTTLSDTPTTVQQVFLVAFDSHTAELYRGLLSGIESEPATGDHRPS